MEKIYLKGIKQVTIDGFNSAKGSNQLSGYLWFVRTPILDDNSELLRNEYSIYLGAKKYGHFSEDEVSSLQSSINEIRKDLGFNAGDFKFNNEVTTINEAFNSIQTVLSGITEDINEHTTQINSHAGAIQNLQDALISYNIKNVDSNDKVLSLADGILSSYINLKYEDNKIKLIGANDNEIAYIDASVFIKDSVLENVEIITENNEKYILFTWNTINSEEPKTDKIKVSDFAQTYTAGQGIELNENNVFNIKLAQHDNFITVNNNNELIVNNITANKTVLSEDVIIKGGAFEDIASQAYPDGKVPSGTSVEDFFKKLLCVEMYPQITASTPDFTIDFASPTIYMNAFAPDSLVEIGQVIKFNPVTANEITITKIEPEVNGFSYGYSNTIDGEIIADTSIKGTWNITQKVNNVYELSASKIGFEGTLPTTQQNANAANCVLEGCSLIAMEGLNTYSVTEDVPNFVGSYEGVDSKYIVSNLKQRSEEKKSPSVQSSELYESKAENQTTSLSVIGVYPIYTNGISTTTDDETDNTVTPLEKEVEGDGSKLPLINTNTPFAVSFASQTNAPYRLYLADGLKITSAKAINPFTLKYSIDCKAQFIISGKTIRTVQGKSVDYNIYEWNSTEGPNRVLFTVGK